MFETQGHHLQPALLTPEHVTALQRVLDEQLAVQAGTRQVLHQPWCRALARFIQSHADVAPLLPARSVAMQCTYFEKTLGCNWLVTPHQDLSIPVRERLDVPNWQNWSIKEGQLFVQPPVEVLAQLVAVRVHVDPCGPEDGALRVMSGTHQQGLIPAHDVPAVRAQAGEVLCVAEPGDALLLRPLLLHASSKATGSSRRRVLHVVFAPAELPNGMRWPEQVQ